MARGGPRGGGINHKSLAMQALKKELAFVESATAGPVPRTSDFEAWVKVMSALLSMRTIGLPYLRYANKSLDKARAFWTKPNQQITINSLAELLIKAQDRHADRAAKRAEKKLVREVLAKQKHDKPVPAEEVPATSAPSKESIWE